MSENNIMELPYRLATHEADVVQHKPINVKASRLEKLVSSTAKLPKNILDKRLLGLPSEQYLSVNVNDKENPTLVDFRLEGSMAFVGGTPFDLVVHEIVCSFYEKGLHTFTSAMVAQEMLGRSAKIDRRAGTVVLVERSLTKLGTTIIAIDDTKQAERWNDGERIPLAQDNILHLRSGRVTINGKEAHGYYLLRSPILLDYSRHYNNEVSITDTHLLDTSKPIRFNNKALSIRHDENFIALKFALKDFIIYIKNKKNLHFSEIRFDTLFERVQLLEEIKADGKKRKRMKSHIEKALIAFKNNGFIKDFKFHGNTLTGKIEITV